MSSAGESDDCILQLAARILILLQKVHLVTFTFSQQQYLYTRDEKTVGQQGQTQAELQCKDEKLHYS